MAMDYTPLPATPNVHHRLVANTVLVGITALVVVLRVLARMLTGSKLGWDDCLILAAVPQGIGMLICQGLWSVTGVGYPYEDLPPENIAYIDVIFFPFELIYASLLITAKLSVLFFYLRVFTHGSMRRATKCVMVFVGLWGIVNLMQFLFICRSLDERIDFLTHVQCDDSFPSMISAGVINCLTNLLIGLLPLYTIWSLKTTSVSTRLGLTTVFVLGTCVTLVSVYRIYRLLAPNATVAPLEVMNIISSLAVLETNLSILCNSLPMLLPLYSYWRYRRFYGCDEDEYVSRIRGNNVPTKRRTFAFEDVANGLPLETIYGRSDVHVVTTASGPGEVAQGLAKSASRKLRKSRSKSRGRWKGETCDGSSDGESTRRLDSSAGPAGITIETHWTITEETKEYTLGKV